MKLSELKKGEKASIVKVMGYGGFRKRIVEMGFVKGKIVESLQTAPLNDPVLYKIMGYEVSLRRNEAELIEVVSENDLLFGEGEAAKTPPTILDEDVRRLALKKRKNITVALVGNPNCGKTTLFNFASGLHEHVGNYSGVTVDAKEGKVKFDDYEIRLVDLPGTYSLSPYSPEEIYVRKFIWENKPDVVVNVVDSTNLERNLYLTTQLIDMDVLTIVALNMYDELEKSGDKLDYELLGNLLGMPFVPTVARKNKGINELFKAIVKLYESSDVINDEGKLIAPAKDDTLVDSYLHEANIEHKHNTKKHHSDLIDNTSDRFAVRYININHGYELEKSIARLKEEISKSPKLTDLFSARYLSIKMLEGDKEIEKIITSDNQAASVIKVAHEEQKRIRVVLKEDTESAITNVKYGFIGGALKESFFESIKSEKKTLTQKIDNIVTNRYLGYPIFLVFILIMFQTTFFIGQYPMDWIEAGVGALGSWLGDTMSQGPLRDLLVDGIIGGVGSVIVFLPNIIILYLFISFMEDSGYMARAAFIMDKLMHKIGLHGKSFIPLIMGFGCNVPAIMATRTIENRNSRLVTILVNPLMSCSARLPVYLLLAGAFFPNNAGWILFGIYLTGILLAIIAAKIFSKFLFKKDDTPFVMELPPYRMPTLRNLGEHSWEKSAQYLKKMGTIILVGSIVVWFLGYFPRPKADGELTAQEHMEQQENSYIGQIGHFIEPVIKPLGFDWKGGVALVSGFAAKEIVVSTLGVLYTGNADTDSAALSERLKAEVRPDGSPSFTPVTAIGFMLFVLIYFPCLATIAAIKNESGSWKWAFFTAGYSVVLAWIIAFGVNQLFG